MPPHAIGAAYKLTATDRRLGLAHIVVGITTEAAAAHLLASMAATATQRLIAKGETRLESLDCIVEPCGCENPCRHLVGTRWRCGIAGCATCKGERGLRFSCSCCGESFYTMKPQDPVMEPGFGICTSCAPRVAKLRAKHEGPMTLEQHKAHLEQYA